MKSKKIKLAIFCAILFIGLLGIGSSLIASDLGVFKINSTIQLYQSCENCTFVNLSSVKLPNGSVLFYNLEMTKNAQDYNYSFNSTDLLGEYMYNVCGNKDGDLECEDIGFYITKTGFEETTSNSILHFVLIIFVSFIFGLCLWGAISLPFENRREGSVGIISINKLKYFKIMLYFLSYVLLVWLMNLLFTISNNFNVLSQYNALFKILFKVLNVLSYPLFVIMLVVFVVVAIKDSKIKKLIEEGFYVH